VSRPWLIPFIAVIIGMMALQMSSLGFSPLLPAIQKDFHASYTQIGLFTGVYGLVAIVLSVPAGFLARNYGEKSVLSTGLVIVAIGLFVLSQAHDFTWGLTARIIWLLGYRLSFVCVMIAIALTAPPRLKGSTMGILGSLSSLASVVGAPFGSRIEQVFGWRGAIAAFGGMALLGLIVFAAFYRRSGGEPVAPAHGLPKSTGSRPAYKEPVVWILAGTLGLLNIGGFTMTFFVPAVLQSVFHLRAMDGALMISTAYITAMFANLLCGFLADRVDRWAVMIGIAALLVPASLAMLSTNLLVFRIGVAMLVALGLSATNQGYAITGAVLEGRETGPAMGIVSLGAGVYA
jgi:predicted MFS family arabinose efflux permease